MALHCQLFKKKYILVRVVKQQSPIQNTFFLGSTSLVWSRCSYGLVFHTFLKFIPFKDIFLTCFYLIFCFLPRMFAPDLRKIV